MYHREVKEPIPLKWSNESICGATPIGDTGKYPFESDFDH